MLVVGQYPISERPAAKQWELMLWNYKYGLRHLPFMAGTLHRGCKCANHSHRVVGSTDQLGRWRYERRAWSHGSVVLLRNY